MKNTDPTDLMKLHDKIIRLENTVAGLSEDSVGFAKSPTHYVQFVENGSLLKGTLCLQNIIIQDIFQLQ